LGEIHAAGDRHRPDSPARWPDRRDRHRGICAWRTCPNRPRNQSALAERVAHKHDKVWFWWSPFPTLPVTCPTCKCWNSCPIEGKPPWL
jgi:hypothetical protein